MYVWVYGRAIRAGEVVVMDGVLGAASLAQARRDVQELRDKGG